MPRGDQAPGHRQVYGTGAASCRCGWSTPATGTPAQRAAYRVHKAEKVAMYRAYCRACQEPFSDERPKVSTASVGILCVDCAYKRTLEWRKANPAAYGRRRRDHHLRKHYGISIEQFEQLLADQDGRCAICGTDELGDVRGFSPHVDHCHSTGKVRGILCGRCNQGIGMFHESPETLEAAAEYLRHHVRENESCAS